MDDKIVNFINNYIMFYDLDWWMPKFDYKDSEEGYWKKIKTNDITNTIPDHKIWVKYY
jgi:hypothetical protein